MTQQRSHKRGEVVDDIGEALEVNTLRGILLDISYFVANDRVFKKLVNGKYRSLVKQETRPGYKHYFFRDKNKKKLTLNASKLNLLTFTTNSSTAVEEKTTVNDMLQTVD
jgi:hypothetical protein